MADLMAVGVFITAIIVLPALVTYLFTGAVAPDGCTHWPAGGPQVCPECLRVEEESRRNHPAGRGRS